MTVGMESRSASERTSAAPMLKPATDLTALDLQLIQILQEDGRRPMTEIAREVAVPLKTVTGRVNALRSVGVIDILAVCGPAALGYSFSGLLGLRVDASRSRADIVDHLKASANLHCAAIVAGAYDLLVEFVCRDAHDFVGIIERVVSPIPGVEQVDAFPYLATYFQRFRYPVPGIERAEGGSLLATETFDSTDQRIIADLCVDGRMPLQTIAERLALSESQVRRRVTRMIDSGGLRVMAVANPTTLGFRACAWLAVRVAGGHQVRDVADRLCDVSAVSYLTLPTGTYDIFLDVVARTQEELLRLLDERIRTVPGVERVDVWQHLEPLHWRPLRPAVDGAASHGLTPTGTA